MAEKIFVRVKYPAGHESANDWFKSDLFCPQCGAKSIWCEGGEGDYYEGCSHICLSCQSVFTLPNIRKASDTDLQVFQQLNFRAKAQQENNHEHS